ncbi:hypothetical protein [Aeoliella sp.]|uniref:hypothetical protein n=1 Tax=Aeoliella sp. TaxID=2795800 RepID=UPI003CCBBA80
MTNEAQAMLIGQCVIASFDIADPAMWTAACERGHNDSTSRSQVFTAGVYRPNSLMSQLTWRVLAPLPVAVRLHYVAPDGRHDLTPEVVRQRYTEEVNNSSLVCWVSPNDDRFGLIAGIDEATWHSSTVREIELAYSKPAKGRGNIQIDVNGEVALSSDGFSPERLQWFRQVHGWLADLFPDATRDTDLGMDA